MAVTRRNRRDEREDISEERRNSRSRRKERRRVRNRIIRRLIPMIFAFVLIIIVVIVALATGMLQQFMYSSKQADLYEYFSLAAEDEAAIMLDDEYVDAKAYVNNSNFYLPISLVEDYFFDDFYYDAHENQLLYTYGTGTEVSTVDSGNFILKGDEVYLNVDYVKQFTPLEVHTYDTPKHMEIRYKWDSMQVADVKKATKARILGGIKSDILTSLNKGDMVEIIDQMDTWCRIKTPDGYLGYVENKCLNNYREITPTPAVCEKSRDISHTLRNHKICMGWHQVMSVKASLDGIAGVINNTKGMNVISPTWFSLTDNEGGFSDISSREYVDIAHAKGLEVWILVDNFNSEVSTTQVLSYTDKRNRLAQGLVEATRAANADGINIDFEELPDECGKPFAQFIRELSVLCRKNGLVLSVDNYVPRGYTSHYDRKTQGEYADYVVIMGYDEHYAGSEESGSVASFGFVQDGIEKTLKDVPANQVINGIPFYTRIWHEGNMLESEAVGMKTAADYIASHGISTSWNDECAQNYGEVTENGITSKVWLEDSQSISAKLSLMQSNNLAGVACWKLGMETADVWDTISAYMK